MKIIAINKVLETIQKKRPVAFSMVLSAMVMAGTVLAQGGSGVTTGNICTKLNGNPMITLITSAISALMVLAVLAGFVFGAVEYAKEASGSSSSSSPTDPIKKGLAVPVVLYIAEFVLTSILGWSVDCFLPFT